MVIVVILVIVFTIKTYTRSNVTHEEVKGNATHETTPSLSIVVVTHNRSELLKRALSSILSCTKDGYEIILCADDSSTDTIEVAKKFLRAQDSFIRIPSMRGPAESRIWA